MTLIKLRMGHLSEEPLKQMMEAQSLSQQKQSSHKGVRESTSCEVSRHAFGLSLPFIIRGNRVRTLFLRILRVSIGKSGELLITVLLRITYAHGNMVLNYNTNNLLY